MLLASSWAFHLPLGWGNSIIWFQVWFGVRARSPITDAFLNVIDQMPFDHSHAPSWISFIPHISQSIGPRCKRNAVLLIVTSVAWSPADFLMQLSNVLCAHLNIYVPFHACAVPSKQLHVPWLTACDFHLSVCEQFQQLLLCILQFLLVTQAKFQLHLQMLVWFEWRSAGLLSQPSLSCTVLSLERRNDLLPRSIGKEESLVPPVLFPMSQIC